MSGTPGDSGRQGSVPGVGPGSRNARASVPNGNESSPLVSPFISRLSPAAAAAAYVSPSAQSSASPRPVGTSAAGNTPSPSAAGGTKASLAFAASPAAASPAVPVSTQSGASPSMNVAFRRVSSPLVSPTLPPTNASSSHPNDTLSATSHPNTTAGLSNASPASPLYGSSPYAATAFPYPSPAVSRTSSANSGGGGGGSSSKTTPVSATAPATTPTPSAAKASTSPPQNKHRSHPVLPCFAVTGATAVLVLAFSIGIAFFCAGDETCRAIFSSPNKSRAAEKPAPYADRVGSCLVATLIDAVDIYSAPSEEVPEHLMRLHAALPQPRDDNSEEAHHHHHRHSHDHEDPHHFSSPPLDNSADDAHEHGRSESETHPEDEFSSTLEQSTLPLPALHALAASKALRQVVDKAQASIRVLTDNALSDGEYEMVGWLRELTTALEEQVLADVHSVIINSHSFLDTLEARALDLLRCYRENRTGDFQALSQKLRDKAGEVAGAVERLQGSMRRSMSKARDMETAWHSLVHILPSTKPWGTCTCILHDHTKAVMDFVHSSGIFVLDTVVGPPSLPPSRCSHSAYSASTHKARMDQFSLDLEEAAAIVGQAAEALSLANGRVAGWADQIRACEVQLVGTAESVLARTRHDNKTVPALNRRRKEVKKISAVYNHILLAWYDD